MLLLLLGVVPSFPFSLGVTSGLCTTLSSPPFPDPVSVLLGSESAVRSKVRKQEQVFKVETLAPLTSALRVMQGALPTPACLPGMPVCSAVSRCGFVLARTLPAIFLSLFLSCKFGNTLAGKRKSVMNDNADDPGTLSWQEGWPEEGSVSDTSGSRKVLCPQQNSFENCFEQLSRDSLLFGFPPGLPARPPLGLCFTRAMAESL